MNLNTAKNIVVIALGATFLVVIVALAATTAKKEQDTVAAGLERGEKLFNTVGCANCHPKGGTTGGTVSMMDMEIPIPTLHGAAAHFPTVKGPKKMLVTLGQMNNMCLTMMLKKEALDYDSQEYVDLALYATSLSDGKPIKLQKSPVPMKHEEKKAAEEPVAMLGKSQFEAKCKACHGLDKPLKYKGKKPADWWSRTIKRMQAKGAPGNVSDEDVRLIIEYLAAQ